MDDAHANAWLSQVNQLDKDELIQLVGHYSERYRTAASEVERLNRVMSCLNVSKTPEQTQEIINLLRNSDRPQSHAKLMDDAAAVIADSKYAAMLWDAFEDFQVDNDLIERTNQSIIQETEGNTDLDGCVVSGDWERIFDLFLDEVRRRLLKWPGTKDSSNG